MKRYGRPRRKHRQNIKMRRQFDLIQSKKRLIDFIEHCKMQALVNYIRNEVNRAAVEHLNGKFEPGGIIAKGPTEWGGEYVITDMTKNPVSLSDLSVADALKRQEAEGYQVELKLTGEQYKMIFNPAQNLPPEE